jgi:hypothetical protein
MSEYGYGYDDNIKETIKLARNIFRDLKTLTPEAWVYWQVVENLGYSNWGLIQVNFDNPREIVIQKQYYILKHFSKTLLSDDKYRFLSDNVMEITNDTQLKYILINDSEKDVSVRLQLYPKNITECKISDSNGMYVDYKQIVTFIPRHSIISVISVNHQYGT